MQINIHWIHISAVVKWGRWRGSEAGKLTDWSMPPGVTDLFALHSRWVSIYMQLSISNCPNALDEHANYTWKSRTMHLVSTELFLLIWVASITICNRGAFPLPKLSLFLLVFSLPPSVENIQFRMINRFICESFVVFQIYRQFEIDKFTWFFRGEIVLTSHIIFASIRRKRADRCGDSRPVLLHFRLWW